MATSLCCLALAGSTGDTSDDCAYETDTGSQRMRRSSVSLPAAGQSSVTQVVVGRFKLNKGIKNGENKHQYKRLWLCERTVPTAAVTGMSSLAATCLVMIDPVCRIAAVVRAQWRGETTPLSVRLFCLLSFFFIASPFIDFLSFFLSFSLAFFVASSHPLAIIDEPI